MAVSKDLSTAVAECGAAPSFSQVIVVPALTLISFGLNSKSLAETFTAAGAGGAGGAAVGAGGAVGGAACALPPSPTVITPAMPPPPAPPWNSQKYAYVPGLSKVCLNVPP